MLILSACLNRYFLKVLQRLSPFVQHHQSLKSSPSGNWQNRVFRPSIQQSLNRCITFEVRPVKDKKGGMLQKRQYFFELLPWISHFVFTMQHPEFFFSTRLWKVVILKRLSFFRALVSHRSTVAQHLQFSTDFVK